VTFRDMGIAYAVDLVQIYLVVSRSSARMSRRWWSWSPIPLTIIDGRRVREHPRSHAVAPSREST
jgi:hypothetical protein